MALTVQNLPPQLTAALTKSLSEPANRLHICVAGTGPVAAKAFKDLTAADWASQLKSVREACFSAQKTAREAIAAKQPGRIIFVVHTPTLRAVAGATTSAMAGAFLTTFAQVGGIEMATQNVTCNTVVAGWTGESAPVDMTAGIPAGRYATVDDIVRAIAHLASADAGYVTGATLTVDGGFVVSKSGGGSPLLGA